MNDMKINIDLRPRPTEETAHMLYHFANGISYKSVFEKNEVRYGAKQNAEMKALFRAEAARLDAVTERVLSDLDRENTLLQKYFKEFRHDKREQNFLFRICIERFAVPTNLSLDLYRSMLKDEWMHYRKSGITVNNDGDSWQFEEGSAGPLTDEMLLEQLMSLPYSKEICLQICLFMLNFEQKIDEVFNFMQPFAERLTEELSAAFEMRKRIAELWAESIRQNGLEAHLFRHSGVRIQHENCTLNIFVNSMMPNALVYCPAAEPDPQYAGGCEIPVRSLSVGVGMLPEYDIIEFDSSPEKLNEFMRIVGDKTKFEILCKIRERPRYCHELANEMGLNSGHMSRTLTSLYYAGALELRQENGRVYYSVDSRNIGRMCDAVKALFGENADE